MPNLVTSPQQSRIQRLLALQRPPGDTSPQAFDLPPIEPATLALMQGLTNAKSEHQATEEAKKIAEMPPTTVTTTVDPSTGKTVAHVKNLVLGPPPEQAVQDAYDEPQIDLGNELSATAAQLGGQDPNRERIRAKLDRGFLPLVMAERSSGRGWLGALAAAGLIKALPAGAEGRAKDEIAGAESARRLADVGARYNAVKAIDVDARQERRLEIDARRAAREYTRTAGDAERKARVEAAKRIEETPWADLPEGTDPYAYAAKSLGLDELPEHLKPLVDANRQISAFKKTKAEAEEQRKIEDQEMQKRQLEAAERHRAVMEKLTAEVAAGRIDERQARREQQASEFKLRTTISTGEKYQAATKPYREIDQSFAQTESLAKRGDGPSDYALLLSFVHGIDNTAAREGEVKMAQSAVSLATKARQTLQNWTTGQLLDPAVRAQYLEAARTMRDAVQPIKKKIDERYRRIAEKNGLDLESIGLDSNAPTHRAERGPDGKLRLVKVTP
jgi:hypothetical protein